MLVYSIMSLDEMHLDQFTQDIVQQVRDGVCTMPLFKMTLTPEGIPAIDKAELLCNVYRKFKSRLDCEGVPSGVLIQASIGHGWKLNAESGFKKYVGLNNGVTLNVCFPMDTDFQSYIRAAARRIALENPAHIMLDDDFRLMFRPERGCACEMHMSRFNALAHTNLTREELYKTLHDSDAEALRLRDLYIQTQLDSLIECAKEIRAGIDSVSPALPGSFCLCGNASEAAYEIASIMAGKGNPIVVRLNNANYCNDRIHHFSHIMHRAASQIAALAGKPDYILAETDTCPQNRYSTSAAMLHSHFTFTLLEGAKGAKHWITRFVSYEPGSGKAYRKKLSKYAGFYNELSEINDTLTYLGCKIPVSPVPRHRLTENDLQNEGDGWYSHVLDRLGLPMHFSPSGKGVCFFDGGRPRDFSDEQLLEYLSGSVVLDAPAAEVFIERGFMELLGVNVKKRDEDAPNASGEILYPEGDTEASPYIRELIPLSDTVKRYSDAYHLKDGVTKEILFPAVTSYKNSLGGTVVVFGGDSRCIFNILEAFRFLNETRKKQFIQILSDLNSLPCYYPEDGEVLMKCARMQDGKMFMALLDIGLDPIEELPLVIREPVCEIKRLCPNGKYETVPFKEENGVYTLSLTLNPYDPLILTAEAVSPEN